MAIGPRIRDLILMGLRMLIVLPEVLWEVWWERYKEHTTGQKIMYVLCTVLFFSAITLAIVRHQFWSSLLWVGSGFIIGALIAKFQERRRDRRQNK